MLDVGWYPEYEENGNLVVQVILDKNWDTPIYQSKSNNKEGFTNGLLKAICIAEEVKKNIQKEEGEIISNTSW